MRFVIIIAYIHLLIQMMAGGLSTGMNNIGASIYSSDSSPKEGVRLNDETISRGRGGSNWSGSDGRTDDKSADGTLISR
ncbi:MAG: hypothetical protein IJV22_10095 [Bacteroidales bacterium]|nr:hypothetical protein [Bacteroidales bacterium]MBQ9639888.1 hypothetical protein [Bacteroidales bacterium]